MATNSSPPLTLSDTFSSTVEQQIRALVSLPEKRALKDDMTTRELLLIAKLLDTFDASSSRRAAPSRAQLSNAVSALIHPDGAKLSNKWSKPQLVQVLRHWIREAQNLLQLEEQSDLYVALTKSKSKPKQMRHSVSLVSDDGHVQTLSVVSPSIERSRKMGEKMPNGLDENEDNEVSNKFVTPPPRGHHEQQTQRAL